MTLAVNLIVVILQTFDGHLLLVCDINGLSSCISTSFPEVLMALTAKLWFTFTMLVRLTARMRSPTRTPAKWAELPLSTLVTRMCYIDVYIYIVNLFKCIKKQTCSSRVLTYRRFRSTFWSTNNAQSKIGILIPTMNRNT